MREKWDVRKACDGSDPGYMTVVSDRPAYVAKCLKQYAKHEDDAVLRLVDALVAPRHRDDPPVAEGTDGHHRNDDPDKASDVR